GRRPGLRGRARGRRRRFGAAPVGAALAVRGLRRGNECGPTAASICYCRISVCRSAPVPEERAMGLFVSYSSQDRSAIEPLTAALRRARQQVWFDDDLGGGEGRGDGNPQQIRPLEAF